MKLQRILPKNSGRGAGGRVSVRHQGGREKRFLREIDFLRNKKEIVARVESLEYDPNRTARIALLLYSDGERRYILAPEGLSVGDKVKAGEDVPVKPGNNMPLSSIPIGTPVHNLEIKPGKGGQVVRGAGAVAMIQGKEGGFVLVKLPSGEVHKFLGNAWGTVGQVAKVQTPNRGRAGKTRHMGIRPRVRGVAMHPAAHPHGGGEGRSGIGMPGPKTPWGKPARGVKTRKRKKYSNNLIIQRRK